MVNVKIKKYKSKGKYKGKNKVKCKDKAKGRHGKCNGLKKMVIM